MKKLKMKIQGMTCKGCEGHIVEALEKIGAINVKASFHNGEAIFELPKDTDVELSKIAINNIKYQAGMIEEVSFNKNDSDDRIYDLIIIGSGAAAFSAAIKAIEYGATVAIVERGEVGGTCVNVGCIPSKTLLRAGEINQAAKSNPFIGLKTNAQKVDLATLVKQKDELVNELRSQKYINLIDEYGIDLVKGEARFINKTTIEVNDNRYIAKNYLIATGASSYIPKIHGLEFVDYLTSTTLLDLKETPRRLTVIGSGYIGLELGQLFHNLGSKVTIIQRGKQLLKDYDPEISDTVEKSLIEQGIELIKGVAYERIEQIGDIKKVYITVDGKNEIIESEQLLIATGRKPNTDTLNLSAADVNVGESNEIIIDDYGRTSNNKIYAAGDVTLGPQFVYVAAYEGGIVADNAIGGLNKKIDLSTVPAVTFTNPAIATVGLTEKEAKNIGYDVKTSVINLNLVPRAIVNRETTGIFKLVADTRTHRILGAHIVSENAGDVIYAALLAVKHGLTIENLIDSLAPYLTMAEGLKLAALAFDKDVSKLSCCAG